MSYRYRYQRQDGSQGTVTIGSVKEMAPDEAREMARGLAHERRKGADPAAEKKANREADRQAKETFADLAKQYLAAKQMSVRLGDMRASTVDSYSRMLKLHILPRLGARAFAQMKRAEIKLAINDIMATTMERHAGSHRVVNGGGVAGAALSVVKMIFTWAIREELADKNPAQTLQPPARYRTRERVLSDAEWRGLYGALTTPSGRARRGVTEPVAIAVLMCAFTLLRRASVAGLRWTEINFEDHTWTVPAGRMKSKRSFVVPLSDEAIGLLLRVRELNDGSPLAFPGRDGEGPIEAAVITRAMGPSMKVLKFPTAGPHDLRRTSRTLMTSERIGISFETAERCMDHAFGGIMAKHYDLNAYLGPKRQAFAALASELVRIAEGRPLPSNVVPIARTGGEN